MLFAPLKSRAARRPCRGSSGCPTTGQAHIRNECDGEGEAMPAPSWRRNPSLTLASATPAIDAEKTVSTIEDALRHQVSELRRRGVAVGLSGRNRTGLSSPPPAPAPSDRNASRCCSCRSVTPRRNRGRSARSWRRSSARRSWSRTSPGRGQGDRGYPSPAPAVHEAALFAAAHELLVEVPVAFVAVREAPLDPQVLRAFCASRLAAYKVSARVKSLPNCRSSRPSERSTGASCESWRIWER